VEWEWITAAVLIAVLSPLFGHFEAESAVWTRVTRWLIYLAILLAVEHTVGPPWTWIWVFGLPLIGVSYHFVWCRKHQINPLTAEPRDRYYHLRGWQ
jgi:hypothetical protein